MLWTLCSAAASSMPAPVHPINWWAGWSLLLAGFVVGAAIGLQHHRDDFLGGYTTFRRRMVRLGHISLAALGMVNLLYALSPWPAATTSEAQIASLLYVLGGAFMPTVCFLAAWSKPMRHLFAVPVSALFTAVVLTLWGGGAS